MSLFLLSKEMLKLENMSFLPNIKGLFSLLDNAQVICTGVFVIFIVILVKYANMLPPSIPLKRIFGNAERLIHRSLATDWGMMLQSAPVSTKKSNFWYPYLVNTGIEITGSGIIPNCVRLWFRGNLERIDADGAFRRDESNGQLCSVKMFTGNLFYKLGICLGMCKSFIASSRNIFAGIVFLKPYIGYRFHNFHLDNNGIIKYIFCQEAEISLHLKPLVSKLMSLRAPKGRSNLFFEIASVASLPRNDSLRNRMSKYLFRRGSSANLDTSDLKQYLKCKVILCKQRRAI